MKSCLVIWSDGIANKVECKVCFCILFVNVLSTIFDYAPQDIKIATPGRNSYNKAILSNKYIIAWIKQK